MPILFFTTSSSIIRRCLCPILRAVPPSIAYIFSPLSSYHAITPPEDDDAATTLLDNPQTPHNPISEFLLGECGFSPSQLTRVMTTQSSLSRVRSSETARGAVEVLRDSGLTPNQVIKTIIGRPSLLTLKGGGPLKLKIDFLKTIGLTGQHLANAICKGPGLLGSSLENKLVPRILYLEKLFGSKANLCKAIRLAPSLLYCNLDKQLKRNLDVLTQYDVQGELLSLLISAKPQILTRTSEESLILRLEYVKNMGFLEGSKIFVYALHAVVQNSPENIETKLKHLASLGLGEDEIHQLLMKNPLVLARSLNKVQQNMDFLVNVTGLLPNVVVKYPLLLHYSIEKRLKPRHNVFKALCSMQQTERRPSLEYLFTMTEKKILKYLECSSHSSTLKDVYKAIGNAADRNI